MTTPINASSWPGPFLFFSASLILGFLEMDECLMSELSTSSIQIFDFTKYILNCFWAQLVSPTYFQTLYDNLLIKCIIIREKKLFFVFLIILDCIVFVRILF